MFVPLAKTQEIPIGQFKPVEIKGRQILICHIAEGFYAVDDVCTHDDGPLADGWLEGKAIECPRHGARFDVTDGKVLCLPAAMAIKSYPVQVEGDTVKVDVE